MRWKIKDKQKIDTILYKRFFAIFPIKTIEDETVWLEWVYWRCITSNKCHEKNNFVERLFCFKEYSSKPFIK